MPLSGDTDSVLLGRQPGPPSTTSHRTRLLSGFTLVRHICKHTVGPREPPGLPPGLLVLPCGGLETSRA